MGANLSLIFEPRPKKKKHPPGPGFNEGLGGDAFVSFPTSYGSTFATDAFPHSIDIAKKSFSELQIWLEW